MKRIVFTPVDTLFFRDGRPYRKNEPQADVVSQFPPFAPTLIGAFRAAVARGMDWWSDKERWGAEAQNVLGHGADLGPLQFTGPYLLCKDKRLFPAPLLLLGKPATGSENVSAGCDDSPSHWQPVTRLQPGKPRRCDLGDEVRLPEPAQHEDGLKSAGGYWLTVDGMQDILNGKTPEPAEVIASSDLWRLEARTGNERDHSKRVVNDDDALYSPRHVRLLDGCSLALDMHGGDDLRPQSPAPLGGEARLAGVDVNAITDSGLPMAPDLPVDGKGYIHYCAIFITPWHCGDMPKPGGEINGLQGKLVSACIGRALRVGGWDSTEQKPLALTPLMPAGSVLFMQAAAKYKDEIKQRHGTAIGERTAWGFGQLLIGKWENIQ